MKIRHQDPIIPTDGSNPFVNCKLGRENYAKVLTTIVEGYAEGFVLALDNTWGTGKTTFIKMWRQYLINNGYKTLYFNAWENDFQEEVIIALLSELKELNPQGGDTFDNLMAKTATFMKKVGPAVIKGAISRALGDEATADIAAAVMEYTSEQVEEQLVAFNEKKEGIQDFRCILKDYVDEVDDEKPVVFFIDELDRCRPSYAVEVLEQIKHLFAVPGIVFVISIDKVQLGNAIRGFYGSDRIDAEEYLRRFIDLEYALPNPDKSSFLEYLYDYFGYDEFIKSASRPQTGEFKHDESIFKESLSIFFDSDAFSLRQIERILSRIRIVLNSFGPTQYIYSETLAFLSYLALKYKEVYQNIRNFKYSTKELAEVLENILSQFFGRGMNERRLIFLYASLLSKYNMDLFQPYNGSRGILLTDNSSESVKPAFQTKLDADGNDFLRALEYYKNHFNTSDVTLTFILDRFELTEPLMIS